MLLLILCGERAAAASDGVTRLINPTPQGVTLGYSPWSRALLQDDVCILGFDYASHFPAIYSQGGVVQAFRKVDDSWEFDRLFLSEPHQPNDRFGHGLAFNGTWLAIGSYGRDAASSRSGVVHLYQRVGDEWIARDVLTGDETGPDENFGYACAFAGNQLIVGATQPGEETPAGSIYIFTRKSGQWTKLDRLRPNGLGTSEYFGGAIAATDSWVAVSAPDPEHNSKNTGAVYIYQRIGGTLVERQMLMPPSDDINNSFGEAIAIRDDLLVVNDPRFMLSGRQIGKTYVYRLNTISGVWEYESGLLPEDESLYVGTMLALGDNIIVTGSDADWTNARPSFINYWFDGKQWHTGVQGHQQNAVPCAEPGACDLFGGTVAFDGDQIVIGGLVHHGDSSHYSAIIATAGASIAADCNGNYISDDIELILRTSIDCNGNGIPDQCEFSPEYDCNVNGLCDAHDIARNDSFDCNENGVPDECESGIDGDSDGDGVVDVCDNCPALINVDQADCDGDGVGDVCAIAAGINDDCNNNGVPDQCEGAYRHDNGTASTWWTAPAGDYETMSIQHFVVQPGGETIAGISIEWTFDVPRPATLLVYDDPNDDGDPNDATLLYAQNVLSKTRRDGVVSYEITPTSVGEVGSSFFVAASSTGTDYPAQQALAPNEPSYQWIAAEYLQQLNIEDLSTIELYPPNQNTNMGAWMIRASVLHCSCSGDLAGNDDNVNVADLFVLLANWNTAGPGADLAPPTNVVNTSDLFVLLAAWGMCP